MTRAARSTVYKGKTLTLAHLGFSLRPIDAAIQETHWRGNWGGESETDAEEPTPKTAKLTMKINLGGLSVTTADPAAARAGERRETKTRHRESERRVAKVMVLARLVWGSWVHSRERACQPTSTGATNRREAGLRTRAHARMCPHP